MIRRSSPRDPAQRPRWIRLQRPRWIGGPQDPAQPGDSGATPPGGSGAAPPVDPAQLPVWIRRSAPRWIRRSTPPVDEHGPRLRPVEHAKTRVPWGLRFEVGAQYHGAPLPHGNEKRPSSSNCKCETCGHQMRVIVYDFGLDVNAYEVFGPHPPSYVPSSCPACTCAGRLCGHGVRARVAWLSTGEALEIFVRRLRCSCCRHSFTVLPSFLHPRRRYVLETIEETVVARFVEPKATFLEMESPPGGPASATQRDWCKSISLSGDSWFSGLTHWLATVDRTLVLSFRAQLCAVAGLFALMVHSSLWSDDLLDTRSLRQGEVLERLWLWGNSIIRTDLLPPTRCRAGP
jgi:hypothetical protein